MKSLPVVALALALGLSSVAVLHAEDPPAKPAPAKAAAKGPRVTGVFAKLTDLTVEQKTKIAAVHKQALLDKKKIEDKEQADCMEFLTPEQKEQAEKMVDDMGAKKRAKPDAAPTTEPAKDAM